MSSSSSCEDLRSACEPSKYEVEWNTVTENEDISSKSALEEVGILGIEEYFEEIQDTLNSIEIDGKELRQKAKELTKLFKCPRLRLFVFQNIGGIYIDRMLQIEDHLNVKPKDVKIQESMEQADREISKLWQFVRDCEAGKEIKTGKKIVPKKIDKLRVICWDLGNCFPICLLERTIAMADLLEREKFDIILLQEVAPFVVNYLKFRLGSEYTFNAGRDFKEHELLEFNVSYTLTRHDSVKFLESKIIYFARTGQNRALVKTQVKIGSEHLYVLNAHLESIKQNSDCRINQLKKCFKIFQAIPKTSNVIFGGQLNAREWEVFKHLGVNHDSLKKWDLWVQLGDRTNQFNWDLRVNKLIQMPDDDRPQPHKRFGRIYFRNGSTSGMKPLFFDLCGKELVAGDSKFCVSDHFALLGEFAVDTCYNEYDIPEPKMELPANANEGPSLDENGRVIQEKVKDNWDDSDED